MFSLTCRRRDGPDWPVGSRSRCLIAGCKSEFAQAYSNAPQQSLTSGRSMVRFFIPGSARRALRLTLICLFTIGVVSIASNSLAQTPDEVITTSTALVQLNVGVVDKRGRVVTNLSANDFVVYEDGVRQPIVRFEPTEAPFSLVMMLDTSGSTINF